MSENEILEVCVLIRLPKIGNTTLNILTVCYLQLLKSKLIIILD